MIVAHSGTSGGLDHKQLISMELFRCWGIVFGWQFQPTEKPNGQDATTHAARRRSHSVLEGRKYIQGVPGSKSAAAKIASRNPQECDSVLDGPECIQGVKPAKRRRANR
jgi:hypothetical protein